VVIEKAVNPDGNHGIDGFFDCKNPTLKVGGLQ